MKRIIKWGLLILLISSMCGCGDNNTEKENNTISDNNQSEESNVADTPSDEIDDSLENNDEGVRDETLEGRGRSDIGRSEPSYVGIIGYVAAYSGYDVEDSTIEEWKWVVPTYVQDKQFWVEAGSVEHKTEVLVKEQMLEHRSHGWYEGYLLVENTNTSEQFYIEVTDFVTNPYWLEEDLQKAVKYGDFVAEFNQTSDYYPVNKSADKVELENGTLVLVDGITGTYGRKGPDNETHQVEGVILTGNKKGLRVFFNIDDLQIAY